MNAPRRITYTIRRGDTLSRLARRYRTSVELLMSENPGIRPEQMMPGEIIVIYPGLTDLPVEQKSEPEFSQPAPMTPPVRETPPGFRPPVPVTPPVREVQPEFRSPVPVTPPVRETQPEFRSPVPVTPPVSTTGNPNRTPETVPRMTANVETQQQNVFTVVWPHEKNMNGGEAPLMERGHTGTAVQQVWRQVERDAGLFVRAADISNTEAFNAALRQYLNLFRAALELAAGAAPGLDRAVRDMQAKATELVGMISAAR